MIHRSKLGLGTFLLLSASLVALLVAFQVVWSPSTANACISPDNPANQCTDLGWYDYDNVNDRTIADSNRPEFVFADPIDYSDGSNPYQALNEQYPGYQLWFRANAGGSTNPALLVRDSNPDTAIIIFLDNGVPVDEDGEWAPSGTTILAVTTSIEGSAETPGQIDSEGDITQTPEDAENGVGSGENVETCEEKDAFAWLGCPFLRGIDGALNWIETEVRDILVITPEAYENNVYNAWVVFRNIASILLVIVMLFMVISTALGFDFVDAYTVRKVLPRLVAGAILIQLSWILMTFAINIINAIGLGVFGLMLAPFGGQEATDLPSLISDTDGGGGLFNTLFILGAAGAGIALGFMGLLSLAFTTFLAVFIGFFVLILRNIIVILCLLLAPLAIVAWITPGTNKLWSLWWDSFTKALLMFPFIMMLFAAGRIFAWVTINTGEDGQIGIGPDFVGDAFQNIIVVLAYAIPYFAIPFTLKFAGGLTATLGGMANDRSRGVFDRGKKYRQGKTAENTRALKTGSRFDPSNRVTGGLARGFNRTSAGLATGTKGRFGLGERGKMAMDQNMRGAAVEDVMKNPAWNGVNQNDDALHAGVLMADMSAAQAKAQLMKSKADGGRAMSDESATRAVAAWQASGLKGRASAIAAAQQLVSTGTGYNDLGDMTRTLARASGGNTSTATALAGFSNSEAKKTGRHDLAPSFSTLNDLVQDNVSGSIGASYAEKLQNAEAKTTESSSLYELMNGKPKSFKNQALAHKRVLQSPPPPPTADPKLIEEDKNRRLVASAFFKEAKANMSNAKGAVRDEIVAMDNGTGDYAGLKSAVQAFDSTPTGSGQLRERVVKGVDPSGKVTYTKTMEAETNGDIANDRKRAYERPDPNNIT